MFGGEARSLIAADVLISTNRDWTPEARATIDRRLAGGRRDGADRNDRDADDGAAGGSGRRSWRGWWSCGPSSAAFPLYGTLTLDGGQPYSHALLEHHGALVRPELLTALGVKVGDELDHRHSAPFTIRGVIANEPGRRVGAFSLGPRVLHRLRRPAVDRPARVRQPRAPRAARRACPTTQIDPLVTTLRARLQRTSSSTRGRTASTDDEIGADFDRAENYLSLVGLVIVILGGIAVSSVTRVFVLQKMQQHRGAEVPRRARAGRSWRSTCCR